MSGLISPALVVSAVLVIGVIGAVVRFGWNERKGEEPDLSPDNWTEPWKRESDG